MLVGKKNLRKNRGGKTLEAEEEYVVVHAMLTKASARPVVVDSSKRCIEREREV